MIERREYLMRGVVQGVGFRPHVARIARQYPITGMVGNDDVHVFIQVQGESRAIDQFFADIMTSLPPMARVLSTGVRTVPVEGGKSGFSISPSRSVPGDRTPMPSDQAPCGDCLADMADPGNRRFGYPFTTCCGCGPRFSIIENLPYDRASTTMKVFAMCEACGHEYDDPSDRRYHAQPISCYDCGPVLWISEPGGSPDAPVGEARSARGQRWVVAEARARLLAGEILAVKGVGGFHLMCDARNGSTVERLRRLKRRPSKPFAVMVADLETALECVSLSPAQQRVLCSPERPIVVARMAETTDLAEALVAGLQEVGLMLPSAPLHHLLLSEGLVLVATSGNLSEEPLCFTNQDALIRLGAIADAFVLNDREIHVPVEDSVCFADLGGSAFIGRRSRGFVPLPLALPGPEPRETILAVGGELKNTFALTVKDLTFVSGHLGDMGSLASQRAFETSLAQLLRVYRVDPSIIACDLHPSYATTAWAVRQAASSSSTRLIRVQHHYAHALSLLAEHAITEPSVVAVLDGTGYGPDGTIWGGEVLWVDTSPGAPVPWRRLWHLPHIPLVGGDTAIRQPWRVARGIAHAWELDMERLPEPPGVPVENIRMVERLLDSGFGSVQTSSAGRLFDAASAILGIRSETSYEAQAAAELEAVATSWAGTLDPAARSIRLEWCSRIGSIGEPEAALREAMIDVISGPGPTPDRAWRFHMHLAEVLAGVLLAQSQAMGTQVIGLTGGVAMNRLLVHRLDELLRAQGLELLKHVVLPPNDGSLSVGQTWAAAIDSSTPGMIGNRVASAGASERSHGA